MDSRLNKARRNEPAHALALRWESFAELIGHRADTDRPFLIDLSTGEGHRREWTVGQWQSRVFAVAEWLLDAGALPGTTIATLCSNSVDAIAIAFASWLNNSCCAPLDPHAPRQASEALLQHSTTKLLLHAHGYSERAKALSPAQDSPVVVPTSALPQQPDNVSQHRMAGTGTWQTSHTMPALRLLSSGTTGRPKTVVLSSEAMLVNIDAMATALGWTSDTRTLTVLPVHHGNGLLINVLMAWVCGGSTVLCDGFHPSRFWQDARAELATTASVVPTVLEVLLQRDDVVPPQFTEILSGSGPLRTDTAVRFEDRFGVAVRQLYGLSETTAIATVTPPSAKVPPQLRRKWHNLSPGPSSGSPVPHADLAVRTGQSIHKHPGIRGEILVRGPMMMSGYDGLQEETNHAFRGGWFHTGDEGMFYRETDGSNHLIITGRLKEAIIRGGAKIFPHEVDQILTSHPSVEDAASVGFDNKWYGQEVAAYVVPTADIDKQALAEFCRSHLPFSHCPKVFLVGEEVPRTTTGKIRRLHLTTELKEELSQYADVQFRELDR